MMDIHSEALNQNNGFLQHHLLPLFVAEGSRRTAMSIYGLGAEGERYDFADRGTKIN